MKKDSGRTRIHVPHDAPIGIHDTPEQTMGCRATSPANCRNNGLDGCAYQNAEHICRTPPRGWKKRFLERKGA